MKLRLRGNDGQHLYRDLPDLHRDSHQGADFSKGAAMTLRSKAKRSGSTQVRTVAAIQDVLRYLPGDTLVVTCDDQYVTLEVINGVLVVSDEETPDQMPWEYGAYRKDKTDV